MTNLSAPTSLYEASWLNGDAAAGVLPAGQICGLIHNVLSVKEIIAEMAR